jgi:hypothetical protein
VCPTNKKNGCQRKKETHKTGGGSKKNNKGNSSGELILSIVNKKTVQELTNEFDCDATLELAELEVNKIKVKCAFVKQLRNILQLLAPFTGQPVQHRGYSKPKTKVNANAWVCNIENGNRGSSTNSDA